ncbi:hypothetical protein PPROV_000666200 [Pycnococcus provasolii]|uniref:NADH dehydrogenase [ubiquinone] 1 beta subcomplex subunit 9 n=1 Tax=Pycnococcus provasolii TaxID=41880 RepID=A0A830HQ65_9CHLO|nr:hypothetical protein PPROV_000666200 [Pycnococcus provasolii]
MAGTSQQALRVVHLYRAVIRDLQPYTTNRWMWFAEKEKIRARFEANRNMTDPMQIETTLRAGEAEFQKWRHPDPYTTPYLFGGSRYMRNPPMPADGSISMAFDFGREAGTWDPRDTPATGHHH